MTVYYYASVTNSRAEHSISRRLKSMLIHQGWFTALYTQHLLASQSFEFLICILLALYVVPTYCTKGGYPVTLLPPPRRLVPSLCLGTTWVRQLVFATSDTKCNEQPNQTTANPSVEKYALPPTGFLWLGSVVRYISILN